MFLLPRRLSHWPNNSQNDQLLFYFCFYLKGRERKIFCSLVYSPNACNCKVWARLASATERERESVCERNHALVFTDSFPKCLQQVGLGQVRGRGLELPLGLPCVWQGSKYSSAAPQDVHQQEAGLEAKEKGLKPYTLIWDVDISSLNLSDLSRCEIFFFLKNHLQNGEGEKFKK